MAEEKAPAESAEQKPPEGGEKNYSELEQTAMEMGWNPDHEGEDAKSAKEFILASKDIMKTQKKDRKRLSEENQGLRESIEEIKAYQKAHHETVVAQYREKVADLKSQLKTARKEGDVDRAEHIEEQIERVKQAVPPAPKVSPNWNPKIAQQFEKENPWTNQNSDEYMPDAAEYFNTEVSQYLEHDEKGNLIGLRRGAKLERVLEAAYRATKKLYPEIEQPEQPKAKAPAVEPGKNRVSPTSKKVYKFGDLPSDVQRSAERWIKLGVYKDKEEIMAEYRKDPEIFNA